MSGDPGVNGDTGTSTPHTTQLRALLFTDLCDSTELVERMGDAAAAELFQDHDRLVMALQQRWNGQQIDRSDGLFMLFERPVDALGFALDYQRGLQALGGKRSILLRARMGLHVGEVLLWNNSAESIALGAKPVEVEGLAKPMAARLMQLACPGQLLMSAAAESMARRAVHELGDAGQRLKWKSYGRWRFKGVAQSMEVFGLQDPTTVAPGRPRQSRKATRDIPLWRQPLVMTAQVGVVAALVVGGWFLARPQPAIAFAERDWVVVGGFRNLTENHILDDSLDQAFRISLEQSQHVNIISDVAVSQALERMQQPSAARVDRALGSEIAVRDGARALILPVVAEVGGRLRVSAEVVDPADRRTVYLVARDARRVDDLLEAVDGVSREVRDKLGEASSAMQARGDALPAVATSSLDALKIYALARKAYVARNMDDARALHMQALAVDPQFALAYVGVMLTYMAQGEAAQAKPWMQKAAALRDHLPVRDRLYIDAWQAEFGEQPALHAPARWRLLAQVYPDIPAAQQNYAWAMFVQGHSQDALRAANQAAQAKEATRHFSRELAARIRQQMGDHEGALRDLVESERIGSTSPNRRHVSVLATLGRTEQALQMAQARARTHPEDFLLHLDWAAALIGAGHADEAVVVADEGISKAAAEGDVMSLPLKLGAMVARYRAGQAPSRQQADALLQKALRSASDATGEQRDDLAGIALAAARLQQRYAGFALDATQLRRLAQVVEASGHPRNDALWKIVRADQLRLQNNAQGSVQLLQALAEGQDLVQWHVAMRDARKVLGQAKQSAREQQWLLQNRGRAYGDPIAAQAFMVMNVADLADVPAAPATVVVERSGQQAEGNSVGGLRRHAFQ